MSDSIAVGTEVFDIDGERIGHVIAAATEYIVAEQGLFFPTDYYLPRDTIAEITEIAIKLNITKADALERGWSVQIERDESLSEASPGKE
jgi:hypothetical protein